MKIWLARTLLRMMGFRERPKESMIDLEFSHEWNTALLGLHIGFAEKEIGHTMEQAVERLRRIYGQ